MLVVGVAVLLLLRLLCRHGLNFEVPPPTDPPTHSPTPLYFFLHPHAYADRCLGHLLIRRVLIGAWDTG